MAVYDTDGRAIDEIITNKDLVVNVLGMVVCMVHRSMDPGSLNYIIDTFPVPLVCIPRKKADDFWAHFPTTQMVTYAQPIFARSSDPIT